MARETGDWLRFATTCLSGHTIESRDPSPQTLATAPADDNTCLLGHFTRGLFTNGSRHGDLAPLTPARCWRTPFPG
ncbi:hypothetical protein [Nannocystis sp. SCPEA4]|uniref:hypothetical protein n=1 Tax=Nannocystis sp. SCPEA4 TaxID=2996787 RepID=UPI002270E245|nr:hypothetical protein [Nannocystis sp. SCPEA4]MCY1057606.1 hypothetical protein [Nannocystis sp. SCPEA4]